MDIPYIDDSCGSDGSMQRRVGSPRAAPPLRLSRYSESSDEPADDSRGCGRGCHADELSINNLLDELAADEDELAADEHGLAADEHGLAADENRLVVDENRLAADEDGLAAPDVEPSGALSSRLSESGFLASPLSESGCVMSPLSESGCVTSLLSESKYLASPLSTVCPSATSQGPDSGCSDLNSVLARDSASILSGDRLTCRAALQQCLKTDLSAAESGVDLGDPDLHHPGRGGPSQPAEMADWHRWDSWHRDRRQPDSSGSVLLETDSQYPPEPDPGCLGKSDSTHPRELDSQIPLKPDSQYPLEPDSGYPQDPDSGYPRDPNSGYPRDPDSGYPREPDSGYPSEPDGGLLQDVLQALGQSRFEAQVRVENSSHVTLGPVIHINVPPPPERKDKTKWASPFNSIGKGSLTSSVGSGLERVPPSRQGTLRGTNSPLMGRIVSYLRTRCLDTLTRQQPIPWCPEFRLPLQQYFIALGLAPVSGRGEQSRQPIELEDILCTLTARESAVASTPRRILVQGEPGFGKSTLMLKLLHDWASEDAPPYLSAFQFAFLIPLWEFSGSLFNFTHRELLPRHIVGRDLMVKLWQYLAENEERVLFLLDGLDELRDEHRSEIIDLLSGKLFLNSTVLVTSRPSHAAEALPWVHRRLVIQGFERPNVGRYVRQYFSCVQRPECVGQLEAELLRRPALCELARCPLICLLLCVVFEDGDAAFPENEAMLYRTLFECLMRRSLLRRGERLEAGRLPARCQRMLRQFGKIAVQLCLEGRVHYTEQEIVNHVDREVFEWGFLTRVVSVSKVQKKEIYQPLHRTFTDYLAAQYLASLPDQRALRQQMSPVLTHLERLDGQPKASHGVMVMLRYLMALLNDNQRRAYQALELLSPLNLPARALFSLLRAASSEPLAQRAVALCLSSQQHVLVQTDQTSELQGWTDVMQVSVHQESLEVVYRSTASSPALAPLLRVASRRVSHIKLCTLLGTEMSGDELRRMGEHIVLLLQPASMSRYKLSRLEILLQNLDDSDFGRFQPVVDGLCASLPQVPQCASLKLVLDLDMSAAQMAQLCAALSRAPGVAVLTIKHLVSFVGSISALADLLRRHPLSALTLCSVWQPNVEVCSAVDFFRTEQLVRSPTGAGGVRPRGTSLTRNYSLGRGAAGAGELDFAYRLRLGREPICDADTHVGGFHHLFSALRTPSSRLTTLNLNRCRLTTADLACLGESLRVASCLTNLTVRNVSTATDLVPLLFALQDNGRLQLLDLESSLVVEDAEFILLCKSVLCCHSLLLLDLANWTFKLEWEHSLRAAVQFLQQSELLELQLDCTMFAVTLADAPRRAESGAALARHLPTVKSRVTTVGARGCQVVVNDWPPLSGPDLLPLLQRACPRLSSARLGARPNTGGRRLTDAALLRFFRQCADSGQLRQLRLGHWRLQLTAGGQLEARLRPLLRRLRVSQVYLDGLTATDAAGAPCEHALVAALIAHLRSLQLLSLPGTGGMLPAQGAAIGRALRDRFAGDKLVLYTHSMAYGALRALRSVVEESDRFFATYTGGELGVYHMSRLSKHVKS